MRNIALISAASTFGQILDSWKSSSSGSKFSFIVLVVDVEEPQKLDVAKQTL